MSTLVYSRLPESYGRHGTKVRISEAIEKTKAALEELLWILVCMPDFLIWVTIVKIRAAFLANRKENLRTCLNDEETFWSLETGEERKGNKRREREANKRRSTLKQIEFVEAKKNTALPCYAVAMQTHTAPAPGAPDITSPLNGACGGGNHASRSTQMPMELPSNDPAPVGVSSDDDDPNDIENPHDESSRSTEASPAQPLDITPSSNGASPTVLEDGSERREPPVPHGNGDFEERHNHARPNEGLIMFALQVFQLLFSMKSKDTSLLSRNAEILQYCAEIITCIGVFCGLGGILLSNRHSLRAATRTLSAFGYFSTGLGFLATMCVPLSNKFMFWILGFTGFPFSAIFGYAFWKGWIV